MEETEVESHAMINTYDETLVSDISKKNPRKTS
jgi:hypothetical protein